MKTYLCGGINGLTDGECIDWRESAKAVLVGETLDPMRRDYRGIEADSTEAIVQGDLRDIDECDSVLVNATKPSWGTAMEVFYAFRSGKRVSAFAGNGKVSPWLAYHSSHVAQTIDDAVEWLNETPPSAIPSGDRCGCRKMCGCSVSPMRHCHYCKMGFEGK